MRGLVFETRQAAEQRSREAWETVLGRPRAEGDTTEFMWAVVDVGAAAALTVPDEDESLLTDEEREALVDLPKPEPAGI